MLPRELGRERSSRRQQEDVGTYWNLCSSLCADDSAQVFVYGNSLRAQLVAVVVPDPDTLLPWAASRCARTPQPPYEYLPMKSALAQDGICSSIRIPMMPRCAFRID